MGIRVYEYGLLRPIEGADLVHAQLRGAHRYYNTLVELERKRRTASAAVISQDADVADAEDRVARFEARLERLRTAAKTKSMVERKRGDRRATTKLTIAALRQAGRSLRAAKAEARGELKGGLDKVNAESNEQRKVVRAACGVYWGTYLLIEEAIDAARQSPTPPRFKPWQGHGRIGVQLQGGEPVESLFSGDDTRVRIEPVPEEAFLSPVRGVRRKMSRTKLWIRVGSVDKGREPVWAVFPMIMHREIPPGSIVKRVIVKRTTCATFDRWTVQITVSEPPAIAVPSPTDGGRVAVDLGWRSRGGPLRVGYVLDEKGVGREILVPENIRGALGKANDIRSIRDKLFDRAKDLLMAWNRLGLMPEELRARAQHAHAWRSPGRMVALLREWEKARVPGDEDVFAWLSYWKHRDRHLWQYEAGTRRRALLRRREGFRILAAELVRKYDTLVLELFDLTGMAAAPAPELADDPQDQRGRALRTVAAPSEFRLVLLNAFGKRHLKVEAANTTKTCADCGHINDWDDQTKLELKCSACDVVWDQDRNACRNLLRAAACGDSSGEPLAVKKPGRSERLREAKAKNSAAASAAR